MIKNSNKHLIRFSELDPVTESNYVDYAIVINKMKEALYEETGLSFSMYADDETSDEIFEILEEDLTEAKGEVKLVANIFDFLETATISSKHTDTKLELIIKPRLLNGLYYYPKYQVALAKTPIYQNHSDMNHDFIFAESNTCMLEFLNYVLRRKREYIKNHVTVFTDTDDGVDTKKEKITNLVTREDVFLEESTKLQIYRSIDEFFSKSGEFFTTYNIPYKRGILLYGRPGNGKTTLVKSIANSISAPVAYWQITEYTSSYSIQEVFSTIAKMTPMVLVIEDIDSMPESVRSVFLNTLDGATSKEGIFLIGTTNYPEKIDPALINRSGRFDRAYEIKLPSIEMRFEYLKKKKICDIISESQISHLAQLTDGFSFAQLNELYNAIALQWHYEQSVDIEKICTELYSDNKKGLKLNWDSHSDSKMGFNI